MEKIRAFDRTQLAMALCGGLVLTSTVFAAAEKTDPVSIMIKAVDTNRDGIVSATEHVAGAKAKFDAMDVDHNGQVTTVEMDAYRKKMGSTDDTSSATRIKAMDINNDGMVSAEEYAANSQKAFDAMDANHDGMLSEDEMRIGYDAERKSGNTSLGL
jgi:hypothetical protein